MSPRKNEPCSLNIMLTSHIECLISDIGYSNVQCPMSNILLTSHSCKNVVYKLSVLLLQRALLAGFTCFCHTQAKHPVCCLKKYSIIKVMSPKHYIWQVDSTNWGRDKMAGISQTTVSNAFSWMKIFEFRLIFPWSVFLRVQLTILQH